MGKIELIAKTISNVITEYLADRDQESKLFFKVRGLPDDVYKELVNCLPTEINGIKVNIKSTSKIPGASGIDLNKNETSTSLRNSVTAGQALVLLLTKESSEWQSLKNIFTIDESFLLEERQLKRMLTVLTPGEVDLTDKDKEIILKFFKELSKFTVPQLIPVTEFLCSVKIDLEENIDTNLEKIIGNNLTKLGLFKDPVLFEYNKWPKRLKDNFHASTLTTPKGAVDPNKIRRNLEKYIEMEEGTSAEAVVKDIEDFLDSKNNNALQREWDFVKRIFNLKTPRKGLAEKIREWANDAGIELTQADEHLLNKIQNKSFEEERVMAFLERYEADLPRTIERQLRKLIETDEQEMAYTDFLLGVFSETLTLLGKSYLKDDAVYSLKITYVFDETKYIPQDKVDLFLKLYSGLETLLADNVSLDISELKANEPENENLDFMGLLFELKLTSDGDNEEQDARTVYFKWTPSSNLLLEDVIPAINAVNKILLDDGKPHWPVFDLSNQTAFNKAFSFGDCTGISKEWYINVFDQARLFSEDIVNSNDLSNNSTVLECLNPIVTFNECLSRLFKDLKTKSLLEVDLSDIQSSYSNMLSIVLDKCKTVKQISLFGDFINRLLVILIGKDQILVPLIHPLKLLWWQQRSEQICQELFELISKPNKYNLLIDENKYREYIYSKYSSIGVPSLLATSEGSSKLWVSLDEDLGFELFRAFNASVFHSLDGTDSASDYIFRIIRDYIEVFPFSQDGLDVFVPYCPNVSIITNALEKALSHGLFDRLRKINLTFHHDLYTEKIFQEVNTWIMKNEEYAQRDGKLLFPKIEVNVYRGNVEEFGSALKDYDIAILIDYFNKEELVNLEPDLIEAEDEDNWFRTKIVKSPYIVGNPIRKVSLNSNHQPAVLRLFHNLQVSLWKPESEKRPTSAKAGVIKKVVNLFSCREFLDNLHRQFNWVVCYDPNVDKYLLRGATKYANVIRYHSGLGVRGNKNLTVSSSGQLGWGLLQNTMLTKKLYKKVTSLLRISDDYEYEKFAKPLIEKANKVSGSLVLKGIGPGKFLQEMLGIVLTTDALEKHSTEEFNGLIVWLSLDDYEGRWFNTGSKRPDVALFKVDIDSNGILILTIDVCEVKFTGKQAFNREIHDAQKQVVKGVKFFKRVLNNVEERLDVDLWYREIADVLIENLYYEGYDPHQEEIIRELNTLSNITDINVKVQGHILGFCYDDDTPDVVNSSSSNNSRSNIYEDNIIIKKWLFNKDYVKQALDDIYKYELAKSASATSLYNTSTNGNTSEEQEEDTTNKVLALLGKQTMSPYQNNNKEVKHSSNAGMAFKQRTRNIQQEDDLPKDNQQQTDNNTKEGNTVVKSEGVDAFDLPTHVANNLKNICSLLDDYDVFTQNQLATEEAEDKLKTLYHLLRQHNVNVKPLGHEIGPNVIRIKLNPSGSTRVNDISRLQDDIKVGLSLINNPYIFAGPGYIGVDIERKTSITIGLKQVIQKLLKNTDITTGLKFPLGLNISGEVVVADLADSNTPHLLIAGQTGAGKSVFLSSIILSIMTLNTPKEVKFVMIDPKQVELTPFEGSPYLYQPIITDVEQALEVLNNLVEQMEERYYTFRITDRFINNIEEYRDFTKKNDMPRIVVVFDEFADFMEDKKYREGVESALKKLSAKARASGIHLLICTQTPKAEVVTTSIRNNLTARVGLRVPDKNASNVIGVEGADSLLGKGDLLFKSPSAANPVRVKSPYVSREEMRKLLTWFDKEFN
jgi:S-DNA-T family DNA segregation ATPase FtsK/SpoIIIE